MNKIAARFEIRTSDIKQLCADFDIPRPPNGYWSQVNCGTALPRPPLPELDDEAAFEIRSFRKNFDDAKTDLGETGTISEQQDSRSNAVAVSEMLRHNPHSVVRRLKTQLKRREKGHGGGDDSTNPKVTVSKRSLTRVLRILDAILKHWESVGGAVRESDGGLGIEPDFVTLSVGERYKRVQKKATKDRPWKDWDHVATGELTLEIHGPYWVDGLRRRWADGKIQRIETVLENFFRTLTQWLEHSKRRRLDNECGQRQKQKAHARKQILEQRAKEEESKQKDLMARVEDWEKAQRIRRYLQAVNATLDSGLMKPTSADCFAFGIPGIED